MADYPAPQSQAASAPADAPVSSGLLAYLLFGVSAVTAVVSHGLPVVAPLMGLIGIIAVIIAYVKRGDARGTFVESHFTWLIRTFWWSLLWGIIGGIVLLLLGLILIGIPIAFAIWIGTTIWVIYRIIRGYLWFKDNRAIPGV